MERLLFVIACLGAALSLSWQILTIAGQVIWPHDPRTLAIGAAVFGLLLTLTFRMDWSEPLC
jgi:hypothetical protein